MAKRQDRKSKKPEGDRKKPEKTKVERKPLKAEKAPVKSSAALAKGGKSAKRGPKARPGKLPPALHGERQREIRLEKSLSVQDVAGSVFGKLIEDGPKDPARRAEACESFEAFLGYYAKKAFSLPFSRYHREALAKITDAVRLGSWFAFAMPRGTGKSTICHWAMIWSTFAGWVPYALYVGATCPAADRRLTNLKKTLRFSSELLDDFPEICGPIRHLDGEPRKCYGQKWKGRATGIEWTDRIVFADIPVDYARARNAVIDTGSIDGEIRGRVYETQGGEVVRPSLVIGDDPQTRESAKSPNQCEYREQIIKGDIGFLKGPGVKLGVVIPCTVIYRDDLADRLLDPERNPEFRGVRSKMLESLPDDMKLWSQYFAIRDQSFRDGGRGEAANDFYRQHFDAMNAGAAATWPERFEADELSAVQHAMNLFHRDEASFWSECQNEPAAEDDGSEKPIGPKELEARVADSPWGVVPEDCEKLVGFLDISEKVLWSVVVAFSRGGGGVVIRYGTYPDQASNYVTLATVRRTIQGLAKGEAYSVALAKSLTAAVDHLASTTWTNEAGDEFPISAIGIDSGWGDHSNDVYQFCRRSPYRSILRATKGVGITAGKRPLVDPSRKAKSRESASGQWSIKPTRSRAPLVLFDTNFWKSRIDRALRASLGSPGALALASPPAGLTHRMIAEHLTAERARRHTVDGRTVTEWAEIPGRDNHFLDCIVGAAMLANTIGIQFDLGFRQAMVGDRDERKPKRSEVKGTKDQTVAERREVRRAARVESEVTF